MKLAIASATALCLLAGSALAQTSTNSPSSTANSSANTASAQKIKSDLQSAGFKDVNVTAESFFVQAKTKDGDPVMMTIGPHGMSMIEAVGGKASNSSSSSTSSSNPSSNSSASQNAK